MPTDIAETLFVNPMTEIYNSLRRIFRANDIEMADEEEQQRIAKMVESMVKVQNELVKQTKSSQIKGLLSKMTKDIKDTVGTVITEDTEDIIAQLRGNFENIDSSFYSLKERIDELERKLIEKIDKAKDAQI